MKQFTKFVLSICGLLLLAAFPAFGQNDQPVPEVQINRKPFIDLADSVREKFEKDKVDLAQPFKVVVEGALVKKSENGREIVVLDQQNLNWLPLTDDEAGNQKVNEIARKAILAVSDSGFFGYLYYLGIEELKISFYQNDFQVALKFEMDLVTPERAKSMASGLRGLFAIAKIQAKTNDSKILFDSFKPPNAIDRTLHVDFEMPKDTFQLMINRNLTICRDRK